jgi:hypothetical protein
VLERWDVTLDAAACQESRLVSNYLGLDNPESGRRDALEFDDWTDVAGGGVVYLNPPYLPAPTLDQFLATAVGTSLTSPVVALLPASTGAGWWWRHVIEGGAQVEFLRGRLSFTGPHATTGHVAPWASALVIWGPSIRLRPPRLTPGS